MPNGTADNATQHVAAPLIARQHAVANQKGTGADVIGDDVERARAIVRHAEQLRRGIDELAEQVDLVVTVHALHHRGNAFETHAGIDRGFWQWHHFSIGRAIELHEHEIPDLDVAVTVVIR